MAQKPALKKAKLSGSSKRVEPVDSPTDSSSESSSEENASSNERSDAEDSFLEEDVNEEDESVDESDSEEESGDEEATEEAKRDKFETAMEAILGSKVKAHDASNPILIRNKRPAKEIEEAREESKARRAIRAERLQHKDKARVRDVIPKDPEAAGDMLSKEKKLRKLAQRGVVKLLNAIHSAQSAAIQGVSAPSEKKAAEATTELSKEKFLDMIRMG